MCSGLLLLLPVHEDIKAVSRGDTHTHWTSVASRALDMACGFQGTRRYGMYKSTRPLTRNGTANPIIPCYPIHVPSWLGSIATTDPLGVSAVLAVPIF